VTPAEAIREIIAREMFVAWRSEGGWSGSRVHARETWYQRTPAATMDDWRKRGEQLVESLGASDITLDLASRNPVAGNCPMGCGATLVLAGSTLACAIATCPRPTAAAELLADVETEHIVDLKKVTFTVRHPLRERLDDALMRCDLDYQISQSARAPHPPGLYRVTAAAGGWHWTPAPAAGPHQPSG
jgi:hypothetical protein